MCRKSVLLFLFLVNIFFSFAQNADKVLGKWMSEKKDKIVNIYKSNDLYYGEIVWIKDTEEGTGETRLDIKNPNSKLRTKKIIGTNYLISFSYYSDREVWKEGSIYNFNTGNTYSGKIHINEYNELELTGYYGILWFLGRTQIWTRVDK